jgi:hypothetical protein
MQIATIVHVVVVVVVVVVVPWTIEFMSCDLVVIVLAATP